MGAGATSARSLPETIDRATAERLVADTPGIKWDDAKWKEVAADGDAATRDDILALLDRLKLAPEAGADDDGLGALPVYDGEDDEECFARDGSGLEESFKDCPGARAASVPSRVGRRPGRFTSRDGRRHVLGGRGRGRGAARARVRRRDGRPRHRRHGDCGPRVAGQAAGAGRRGDAEPADLGPEAGHLPRRGGHRRGRVGLRPAR